MKVSCGFNNWFSLLNTIHLKSRFIKATCVKPFAILKISTLPDLVFKSLEPPLGLSKLTVNLLKLHIYSIPSVVTKTNQTKKMRHGSNVTTTHVHFV